MTELKEHQKRIVSEMQDPRTTGKLLIHSTGSGKSLTAIATASGLGANSTVVVPASLRGNFSKEVLKHKANPAQFDVKSYEAFAKDPTPSTGHNDLLILDEAHKLKNSDTRRTVQALENASLYKKKLLLTATPLVNSPSDIAPLINIVSNNPRQLPESPEAFNKQFTERRQDHPGWIRRNLFGAHAYDITVPKNMAMFRNRAKPFVDFYDNPKDSKDFPSVSEYTVKVPLTKDQENLYNYVYKELPGSAKSAIENNLPASRKDTTVLNRFLNSTRQISNTTRNFGMNSELASSPKIDMIVERIKSAKRPSVVYSNYLDSGVYPLSHQLAKANIAHEVFTGKMNDKQKADVVKRYNSGKLKALIISSSGGEGLDLKGTGALHLLENHWNSSKIEQIKGRVARYQSHSALAPSERNVAIYKYLSTMPAHSPSLLEKLHITKPAARLTADEYLENMSATKKKLNDQFITALR